MKTILLTHAARYPLMEPRDAVKLIYQNEFGGGHLIRDARNMNPSPRIPPVRCWRISETDCAGQTWRHWMPMGSPRRNWGQSLSALPGCTGAAWHPFWKNWSFSRA